MRQRADRTQVDDVGAHFRQHAFFEVGRDFHILAAADRAQLLDAGDFGHEADAAGALDAARHRRLDQGTEILVFDGTLVLGKAGPAHAEGHGLVLQVAFTALVADRAIKRVIEEQKLHHPFARLFDHRRARADDLGRTILVRHQVVDAHGARGDRLGHALHFDQAHAAVTGDRQALVVAEARHVNAGLLAGLDQCDPVLDLDRCPVDDQLLRHDPSARSSQSDSTMPFCHPAAFRASACTAA
jgi:hypothetical protein